MMILLMAILGTFVVFGLFELFDLYSSLNGIYKEHLCDQGPYTPMGDVKMDALVSELSWLSARGYSLSSERCQELQFKIYWRWLEQQKATTSR